MIRESRVLSFLLGLVLGQLFVLNILAAAALMKYLGA